MSGLAGLLAGHQEPGIYRWQAAFDAADVRRTVEHAGARFGHVDGWTHTSKTETLDAFALALDLPEWFGRNLDALADCLRDLEDPVVVLWDGWAPLAREDHDAFTGLLGVLAERATDPVPFSVLLRGDGPDLDIAALG